MKFTKNSTIGDVINADENNAVILQGFECTVLVAQ